MTNTSNIPGGHTPPCPHCGKAVETFEVEQQDFSLSMVESYRVLPPAVIWVNPCHRRISGYVATEDGIVVEWKP